MIILKSYPQFFSYCEYENNCKSSFQKSNENLLIFSLNEWHYQSTIEISVKNNQIPVVLAKQKYNYSGIDLIELGWLPLPLDNFNHDALLQRILDEILNSQEESHNILINKDSALLFYSPDS